jgi:8-oxo-dGTP pyrophosphatase MutT (NUDIX family)
MGDNTYCNNCGKPGHLYHQCKLPITSYGVIAVRVNKSGAYEYLMIRRRDTLGYIDFMRGKYSVYNKDYVMNMIKQMTDLEKTKLKTLEFSELWLGLWGTEALSNQYKSEESISRDKLASLRAGIIVKNEVKTISDMIDESNTYETWTEPEWGFPKGRRNYQEKDYDCALREFQEETGYSYKKLHNIVNILPYEEIFTGSNYKSYKHKYFVCFMEYEDTDKEVIYEPTEVSKMEWKRFDDCIASIRSYNLEKIQLITNIHNTLLKYSMFRS